MPVRYSWSGDTAMRMGRLKTELVLADDERLQLHLPGLG
jgi:hypothetical protein